MVVLTALHLAIQVKLMSLIKDFNDLHIGTKGTLLNILSTVPFFFIGIYLFHPVLILKVQGNPLTDIDFYFLLSICMALSILWFFMNFTISTLLVDFFDWINEEQVTENEDQAGSINSIETDERIEEETKQEDEKMKGIFIITYIYSIGYLALAIFLNLSLDLTYKWFVLACFGFIVFRLLLVALSHFGLKRHEKKTKNRTTG